MENHRKYFDSIASEWDSLFSEEERIKEAVDLMNISPYEIILDVGCGTGRLIPHLKKRLKNGGRVFGLDLSLKMLLNAKMKKYSRLTEFVNGCAEYLPFKEKRFSRIICFAVFPHIIDKKMSVREFNRLLQKNGILNILHLRSREELNEFHKNIGGVLSEDLLPDEDTMRRILENGGFKDIIIVNKPSFYHTQCIKV